MAVRQRWTDGQALCGSGARELAHGDPEAALEAAQVGRGPAARALAAALASAPWGDAERGREAAWLAASRSLEAARVWMRPLEVIASLAPMLGLFGTVLGMIEAFAELEAAGARVDPSILSGGIWEALLTNAVGLAVAIPAVAAFNWFERRIERAEALFEQAIAALFSSDLPATAAPTRRAKSLPGAGRFRAVAPG
jgi:biopolymer transport protein ExbB